MGRDPVERVGGEGPPRSRQERRSRDSSAGQNRRGRAPPPALLCARPSRPRSRAKRARSAANGGAARSAAKAAGRVGDRQRRALRPPLRASPLARRRPQVEEASAAERALRRDVAHDEPVLRCGGDRPVEHELHLGLGARRDRAVAERRDPRADLGRAVMQTDRKPLADRLWLGRQTRAGARRCGRSAREAQDRATKSPRRMASFATSGPARPSAQRSPARAASLARFCACSERTRRDEARTG